MLKEVHINVLGGFLVNFDPKLRTKKDKNKNGHSPDFLDGHEEQACQISLSNSQNSIARK